MPTLSRPAPFHRPRFGRIPMAMAYAGIGRTRLYDFAGKNPGLFRKNGVATLVDFDRLDEILEALPAANIKPPRT
jgi:hypothetical protein